jgi:cathepsin B
MPSIIAVVVASLISTSKSTNSQVLSRTDGRSHVLLRSEERTDSLSRENNNEALLERRDQHAKVAIKIQQDLSALDASYYASYFDANKSFQENCIVAVKSFEEKTGLLLNAREKTTFEGRSCEQCAVKCRRVASPLEEACLQQNLRKALDDNKPCLACSTVEDLNSQGLPTTFKCSQSGKTNADYQKINGKTIDPLQMDQSRSSSLAEQAASNLYLSKNAASMLQVPESFDARKNWADCADIIGQIHNQGTCGSCWAFAAVHALESQLCSLLQPSRGNSSKVKVQLSRGYATSCTTEVYNHDGCKGGAPQLVYKTLQKTCQGIVTGGTTGCSPYFGTGEGTDHFVTTGSAPSCPTQCEPMYKEKTGHDIHTGRFYMSMSVPESIWRSAGLSEDPGTYMMIFPVNAAGKLLPLSAGQKFAVQNAMMTIGPMSHGFYSPDAFFGYSSGLFVGDGTCQQNMPNHEMMGIGWGKTSEGEPYWLGINSWGEHWGENGTYKIKECLATDWTIQGRINLKDSIIPSTTHASALASEEENLSSAKSLSSSLVVQEGPCQLTGDGCLSSPNYPAAYGQEEYCKITVSSATPVRIVRFETEDDSDYLMIENKAHSGKVDRIMGADGAYELQKGDIIWTSDAAGEGPGWKLCPPETPGVVWQTPSPTVPAMCMYPTSAPTQPTQQPTQKPTQKPTEVEFSLHSRGHLPFGISMTLLTLCFLCVLVNIDVSIF